MSTRSILLIFTLTFDLFAQAQSGQSDLSVSPGSQPVEIRNISVYSTNSSLSRCTAWVDDNSYDGECTEYLQYCDVFLEAPEANVQGVSPRFRLMDPILIPAGEECAGIALNKQNEWAAQNASGFLNEIISDEGIRWIYSIGSMNSSMGKSCGHAYSIDGGIHIGNDYFVADGPVVILVNDKLCQH